MSLVVLRSRRGAPDGRLSQLPGCRQRLAAMPVEGEGLSTWGRADHLVLSGDDGVYLKGPPDTSQSQSVLMNFRPGS